MHSAKRAAAALVLGVILTGCGSSGDDDKDIDAGADTGSTPSPSASEAPAAGVGACIASARADSDGSEPDLETPVPCTEPHLFEITDIVDLPDAALDGETDDEKLAHRASLLAAQAPASPSPAYVAFQEFSEQTCQAAIQAMTGLDAATVNGISAADARVGPMLTGTFPSWSSLSTEEAWLAGDEQLVCSARFVDVPGPEARPEAATSPVDAPLMSTFLTADFPVERRQCLTYTGDTAAVSDCLGVHYGEFMANFDALAVLGADFVNQVTDLTGPPSDAVLEPLGEACLGLAAVFLDPGFDDAVLSTRGDLGGGDWGTPNGAYYGVQCIVKATESLTKDLPPGSLVGSDGRDLALIDVG